MTWMLANHKIARTCSFFAVNKKIQQYLSRLFNLIISWVLVGSWILASLLFSLSLASPTATLGSLLESCVHTTGAHFNLSNGNLTVQLLGYYEPMISFLNGAYHQWEVERSLRTGTLNEHITAEIFGRYSFERKVLPALDTHCR